MNRAQRQAHLIHEFADGFRRHGHATSRAAVEQTVCTELRREVLCLLSEQRRSWLYEPVRWGWLSPRNTSFVKMASSKGSAAVSNRHIVLPRDSAALAAVVRAVAAVAVAAGLPGTAQLVELSAAITLPGAKPQLLHSDISAANWPRSAPGSLPPPPLVTCWVALQDVTPAMGPTRIYPASHIRFRERQHALDLLQSARQDGLLSAGGHNWALDSTSADAFEQRMAAARARIAAGAAEQYATAREQAEFGDAPAPIDMTMQAGDVGVMDCRASHLGSEYPAAGGTARQPARVLLNATWASPTAVSPESEKPIDGFTYHIRAHSHWAASNAQVNTRQTIQEILQ